MKFFLIFTCLTLIQLTWQQQQQQNKIIYLTEKSGRTLSLKGLKKENIPILWSYKRLTAIPIQNSSHITTVLEQSEKEESISLDTSVLSNLQQKYSIETSDDSVFNLTIKNLTHSDSGLYKCQEWDKNRIFYQLIVISPITKPELTSNDLMKNTPILESSNLTLKCMSNYSYPYPTIKWFKNDKELVLNQAVFKLIDKEKNSIQSELKLVNLTSDQNMANYSCKLMQENHEQLWQTSDLITLNIAFKPIVQIELINRTTSDKNLKLYNDSNTQFRCGFKSNPSDMITIEWKLNNQIQTEKSNVFNWLNRTQFDLSIKTFDLTCLVTNSIGTGQSSYQITLIHEPVVSVEKIIYEVDELNGLKLTCDVDSSPRASLIEWRHFNNDSSFGQVLSTNRYLEFKSVKHTETNGYYVCSAQNEMIDSFGKRRKALSQSTQIEINVRFEPKMNSIQPKLAVDLNQTRLQNLSCLAMANPQPTFNWFKNGAKLNFNQYKYSFSSVLIRSKNVYENVLTINNLNDIDLATYECEATNQLGRNKVKIDLVKISRPDAPVDLRLIFVDFMSISLTWSASFDGGLSQSFQIKLNDTVYTDLIETNLANLTYLNYNTLYTIRIKSNNKLGSSEWSEPLNVRTHNLDESHLGLLPIFNSLHLNLVKNQLEYELSPSRVKFCFKLKQDGYKISSKCMPIESNKLSLDDLLLVDHLNQTHLFRPSQVKILNVFICFDAKQSLCLPEFNAQIDTFKYDIKSAALAGQIPISLITAICVCILSLLAILFFSVLYCIRKRNFRLCKNLLDKSDESSQKKPVINTIEPQTNKSFDLPSSSNNSTSDGYASADSNLVSSGTLLNTKRNIVSAISATATNLINSTLARNRQSEILVTEDDEQQLKTRQSKLMMSNQEENSSTGVSNCSSLNNNGVYIYSDLNYNDQIDSNPYNSKGMITYVDTFNANGAVSCSGSGSNTDPIAINNSLSSHNSSVDSPTYGYNVAAATITNPSQQTISETDNLIYIKNGCLMIENFVQIDETASYSNATILRQQQQQLHQQQQSRTNSYVMSSNQIDTPESGYSTPSRLKKVVYEVIV